MKRRDFLRSTGVGCAGLALSRAIPLFADTPSHAGWRTFEVTTRGEVLKPSGVTHIWLPAALIRNTPFERTQSNKLSAEGGKGKLTEHKQDALGIISASFPEHTKPALTLTSRVSLKDYAVDLSGQRQASRTPQAELEYFLRPSK